MRALVRTVLALALLSAAIAVFTVVHRPALAQRDTSPQQFAPEQVDAGARLATAGNCAACHSRPDGRPYAGGLPISTSFGTIYATNITPDREAGIGGWTLQAFTRAMREGTASDGTQLYPAFPYDHYTKLTDDDVGALYAYLMTRDPAPDHPPQTKLRFPFSIRALTGGWKLLFLNSTRFKTDRGKGDEWNRGAYLVQALGHCGSCHTPRNALGAEESSNAFDGGVAGGWWAPPLNAKSPALIPWTAESLFNYLRSWDADHGGAAGPMAEVTASLQRLPESDVRAMAVYLADLMKGAQDRRDDLAAIGRRIVAVSDDDGSRDGQAIFRGACASCHDSGGAVPFTTRSLAQHSNLHGPDPGSVATVILNGIAPPEGAPGGIMPGFSAVLTDPQAAHLLAYLRRRYTNEPPWSDTKPAIQAARKQAEPRSLATR